MSAIEHFESIDAKLAAIRGTHDKEMQALKDQLMAAQLEAQMHKDAAVRAIEARASAERIAERLLTEFATVAIIFDRARVLAIECGWVKPADTAEDSGLAVDSSPVDSH